jgi:hypothetical protein
LEHFRSRRLLLQCLTQVRRALAQFVEQSRVLDGNDGLGCEVLHQRDLLVSEGPHLLAVDTERTHKFLLSEHRHDEQRASGRKLSQSATRLGRLAQTVRDVDNLLGGC